MAPFLFIFIQLIKQIAMKKSGLGILILSTVSITILSCGGGSDELTTTTADEEIVVEADEKPTAGGLGGLFGDIMKEVTDSMT